MSSRSSRRNVAQPAIERETSRFVPRGLRWVARYLPFIAGCCAIYWVSAMPKPPVPKALLFPFSDKLMHAVAYGGLAGLAAIGTFSHVRSWSRARWAAFLMTLLYGISDEIHQSFVPHRTASFGDILADGVGALVISTLALGVARRLWGAPRAARTDASR